MNEQQPPRVTAADRVAEFNARFPVGKPVRYYKKQVGKDDAVGAVAEPARVVGRDAMVRVGGCHYSLPLSHVCAVEETLP